MAIIKLRVFYHIAHIEHIAFCPSPNFDNKISILGDEQKNIKYYLHDTRFQGGKLHV